jgi:hypothetical protein
MDFNYTTEAERRDVYHVLHMCPEARKIQDQHHQYGAPPANEKRKPCIVCLDTINAWLTVA